MAALPKEFRSEPVLALAGGNLGIDIIIRVLRSAWNYLSECGGIVIEIGACKPQLMVALPRLFSSGGIVWLSTSNSDNEVFYVRKKFLTEEFL